MANQPANSVSVPKNKTQYLKTLKKGQKLRDQKKHAEALQFLNAAWKYSDDDPVLLVMISDSLFSIGNKTAAINLMVHAVEANPNNESIALTLGNAALGLEEFQLAQKFYQNFIQLRPSDPVGYNNFATALREDGKIEEAIDFLQNILPVFPDSDQLWNTLAGIVSYRDGPGNAIVFYEESLKLNPENVQTLNNIASALTSNGDIEKAEKVLKKAINLQPELVDPHLNYSFLLLQEKKMSEGWEHYQHRLSLSAFSDTIRHNKIPYWKGEDIKGKKIAIFAEQGVGDEIMFSWLFDKVIGQAGEVAISCQRRLYDLFKNSFPNAKVSKTEFLIYSSTDTTITLFADVDISEYDYQVLAGDLPYFYWKDYTDISPPPIPTMKPSKSKIEYWQKKIEELPHNVSIGIAWRSGIRLANRSRNYASLLEWEPILKQKNINIVNIQYGDCENELNEFKNKTGIEIHNLKDLDLRDDFENTTAMMQSLDLVMGPASSPLMQAAFSGVQSWYFTNGLPWWAFGDNCPAWSDNARIFAKNPNLYWADYLSEQAKEVKLWLDNLKKQE